MNIHEYQAKILFKEYGVAVPQGKLVTSGSDAKAAMMQLGCQKAVVKAQIHAGGRGKGGGVKLASSPEECESMTQDILGMMLVTHQTGREGKKVRKVYIEAASQIKKEYYLALTLDRENHAIGVMFSTEGGMDIEEVAENSPEKLNVIQIDPTIGLQPFHTRKLTNGLNLPKEETKELSNILKKLFTLFVENDCSLVEINPLIVNDKGNMIALDAKVNFDDNALFRQKSISELRDVEEEDPREVEASRFGLSYIGLDGNIACMVNGAGLAMATMDIIKHYGGEPANFLDVGGGASEEAVTNAFKILMLDKQVKAIFVNIFGGIMKCDLIAQGIVAAASELELKVPLVIRLEGTNVEQGREILSKANINLVTAVDMADGARRVVELANSN